MSAITRNSTVSFGVLMTVGSAILLGYNLVLNVKFQAESVGTAEARLEARVEHLEQGQNDMQSIKTDIAVIKTNLENIQKSLPLNQGRK